MLWQIEGLIPTTITRLPYAGVSSRSSFRGVNSRIMKEPRMVKYVWILV
jgi:hypothetical protein